MNNNDRVGNKQISINMVANIIAYSSNILISFILTPFLINTLGKETYSFYPIANTFVVYMSVITNSMNTMASRFVTVSLVRNEKEEANKYFTSVLSANSILGLVLLVPMVLIVMYIDQIMEVPINSIAAVKTLFSFVFASALVNILGTILGIATFAKNRIDLRSIREIVTAVLRVALFVLIYKYLPPSIAYVGIVTFIVALVNIAFQYKYTKILLPEIQIKRQYVSLKHTRELFSSSVWNMINSFGNTLLTGMTLILANLFYGAAVSGTYSIVQTVPQFINGVICMLVGVFYPVITYKYAQNDKNGLIREINKAQRIIGAFGCAIIVVFSSLAKEFFSLWTPGENSVYLSVLSLITILPHICISCMWTLTNLNVVMNKVRVPAQFTLGIGVTNIIIAYLSYKIASPGLIALPIISSILQMLWIGVFIPQYVCRNLKVKWNTFYEPFAKALCCSVLVALVILFMKGFFQIDTWLKFVIFGGIMGLFGLAVFSIGMIGFRTIGAIIQKIFDKVKQ